MREELYYLYVNGVRTSQEARPVMGIVLTQTFLLYNAAARQLHLHSFLFVESVR
jgi:hypothetical protein